MDAALTQELLNFIRQCPSCFHTADVVAQELRQAGFVPLAEGEVWKLQEGGCYYVTRNQSSLIAFRLPKGEMNGFMISAAHGESPCFKIKPVPELEGSGSYARLNVERYGGMIDFTWLDRPLSVAGRLVTEEGEELKTRLVNIDRDLLLIPNLAIHMDRQVNNGKALNAQKDLIPLLGDGKGPSVLELAAEQVHISSEAIRGFDLFLYNRMPGSLWGSHNEFVSAPRLDDLQCVFAALQGFLQAGRGPAVQVMCMFDNEEVGSGTKQGAKSTFLRDTLCRITEGMGKSRGETCRMLANSFMMSADNGHAVHPNLPEKADPVHQPHMNGGVVVKLSFADRGESIEERINSLYLAGA